MNSQPREVLTPLAASVLFGKSGEAVRRATAEGVVTSPCTLRFSDRPIRLIDLESAIAYWHRSPRPEYSGPLRAALKEMRLNGMTFAAQEGNYNDDSISDDPLCTFRLLHPFPLVECSALDGGCTVRRTVE